MKTITIKLTGIRPLIMHNSAMIDPDNKSVREMESLKQELKKKKKDDFDGKEKVRREIERVEWEGSLYWNGEALFVPGENIQKCIVEGARRTKAGKRAESAIVPIEDVPLRTAVKGNVTLDQLYARPEFSIRKPVRIPPRTGARLMKVRPIIPTGWELAFAIEFDETELPEKDLRDALATGGTFIGLGDWRPKFGRFIVEAL